MLDELIKSIVSETVKQTLQELGALDQRNQDVPDTMTVKQLAKYLNMSEQWVYEKTKEMPHEKRGRKTLFIKSEIDEWRQEQREEKENRKQKTIKISSAKPRNGLYKVV
jgi:excisionase family DNA binding protein